MLIAAGPGIGDTFLASPVAAALKERNPNLKIDFLVRQGRAAYIKSCPEINTVIEYNYKSKIFSYLKMVFSIFRKYDLAISTSHADRYILALFYAAPRRIAVLKKRNSSNFWQHFLCHKKVIRDEAIPVSELNLQILRLLDLDNHCSFLWPKPLKIEDLSRTLNLAIDISSKKYITIHSLPSGKWKELPYPTWLEIIKFLTTFSLPILLTGGPGEEEISYNQKLALEINKELDKAICFSVSGKTDFLQLCALLENSLFHIGSDTVTAHLAAAKGLPCFTIFGSVNHLRWGPRPANCSNYSLATAKNDSICNSLNSTIYKANCSCPGNPEGCSQAIDGYSKCLYELEAETLIKEIKLMISKHQLFS